MRNNHLHCIATKDKDLLRRYGITHIINCASGQLKNHFEGEFHYTAFNLSDSADEYIMEIMYHIFDIIESVRSSHLKEDGSAGMADIVGSPRSPTTSGSSSVSSFGDEHHDAGARSASAAGKEAILIHCQQGVSRSCSVVIAYLMCKEGMTYDDALKAVKRKRSVCKPNVGFEIQLREWGERRVHVRI